MIGLALTAAVASLAASPAAANPPPAILTTISQAPDFQPTGSGISLPASIGDLRFVRQVEFSNRGEHIDDGLTYRSEDGRLLATVYLYLPSLPHAGLGAFVTDRTIRTVVPAVRGGATRLIAAGGVPAAAITMDYENYLGGHPSSSAFLTVSRWMVKVRVTGGSAGEAAAARDAIVAALRFAADRPGPAVPLSVEACSGAGPDRPAGLIANQSRAQEEEANALATSDAASVAGRLDRRMCTSSQVEAGEARVVVLRTLLNNGSGEEGRAAVVVPLADNGAALEVVRSSRAGGYQLLLHEVGRTVVLATFAGLPSDAQIAGWVRGEDREALRMRRSVIIRPDRRPAANSTVARLIRGGQVLQRTRSSR